MKKNFDKDYFHGNNYNYSETESFYDVVNWSEIAKTLLDNYYKYVPHKKEKSSIKVIDIGCAKGYLVQALINQGVKAKGCDVSEFAVQDAPSSVKHLLTVCNLKDYVIKPVEIITAYGVLHYLKEKEVEEFFDKCKKCSLINIGQFPTNNDKDTIKAWKKSDAYTELFKPFSWWCSELLKRNFVLVNIERFDKTDEVNCFFVNRKEYAG